MNTVQGQKETKNQHSTASSQEEKSYQSSFRLINSEHLSTEMAVNYLFEWRANSKLLTAVLNRLQELCFSNYAHYIPTIVFVMSLETNDLFEQFCEKMANRSLSHYLLLRWSYATYLETNRIKAEAMHNRLDTSLLKNMCQGQQGDSSFQTIRVRTKSKQILSNYGMYLNDFFERLFKIPYKLKSYEKGVRNQRLKHQLKKVYAKFVRCNNEYLDWIVFPIDLDSNVLVNILDQYCFTFSTKERVPFKLVMETISFEDAMKLKNKSQPSRKLQGANTDQFRKPLILPQSYFGRQWKHEKQTISKTSQFSNIGSYQIKCYMIKSGDDIRQEYMAMQLIKFVKDIAEKENLKIWLKTYSIVPYNSDSGLIEFIDDTRTVSYLKQASGERYLKTIYQQLFGLNWQQALLNFVESLAGYSIVQYLFKIKDRHNNNILIDIYGHIIHIDFSFIISSSPGNFGFEKAPFKLTQDYMQLMDGSQSDIFQHFKLLFFLALKFLRKYKKEIMEMILMMTHCADMKCFQYFDRQELQRKFHENATDEQLQVIVEGIVNDALNSYTTGSYDTYQWFTNFIYS